MALRVNHSLSALKARHAVGHRSQRLRRQLERLSSGLRVNRAADDASGLIVSEGMRSELAGLGQSLRNAEQATNLLQAAEGSLQQVNDILIRLRELAVQSASSTVTDTNREALAAEFGQLVGEVDRIAEATTYNKLALLTGFGNQVSAAASSALMMSPSTGVQHVSLTGAEAGTYSFIDAAGDGRVTLGNGTTTQTLNLNTALAGGAVVTGTVLVANFDRLGIQVSLAGSGVVGAAGAYVDGDLDGRTLRVDTGTGGIFHVGPSASQVNRIEMGMSDLRGTGATLNLGILSVAGLSGARQALSGLDAAIAKVANERGKLGAVQNRLAFSMAYTENGLESIQASESAIRDADVALEVTEYSRSNILLQSSSAMLVQANASSLSALGLL